MTRKPRKFITFESPRYQRVQVRESGVNARGNRHYTRRRPDGPLCPDCGARWEPVCSEFRCPGSKVPRAMIRSEKRDGDTRRYSGHPELEAKHPRRGSRHAAPAGRKRRERVPPSTDLSAARERLSTRFTVRAA